MTRILLAEDERNLARILSHELEAAGYQVDIAEDGVEAVLKAIDIKYDIALLDIKMPHLDGINVTRILKKMTPKITILVFSGVAGSGEMAQSIRAGAIKCLIKPFSVTQLLSEIKGAYRE